MENFPHRYRLQGVGASYTICTTYNVLRETVGSWPYTHKENFINRIIFKTFLTRTRVMQWVFSVCFRCCFLLFCVDLGSAESSTVFFSTTCWNGEEHDYVKCVLHLKTTYNLIIVIELLFLDEEIINILNWVSRLHWFVQIFVASSVLCPCEDMYRFW